MRFFYILLKDFVVVVSYSFIFFLKKDVLSNSVFSEPAEFLPYFTCLVNVFH